MLKEEQHGVSRQITILKLGNNSELRLQKFLTNAGAFRVTG